MGWGITVGGVRVWRVMVKAGRHVHTAKVDSKSQSDDTKSRR